MFDDDAQQAWDDGDDRDWEEMAQEAVDDDQVYGADDELFYMAADMVMAEFHMGWRVALIVPPMTCGCSTAWISGNHLTGFVVMGCTVHDRPTLIFTNN